MPGDPVRVVSQSSPQDSSKEYITTLLKHGLLSHSAPHSLYTISFCIISLFVLKMSGNISNNNRNWTQEQKDGCSSF